MHGLIERMNAQPYLREADEAVRSVIHKLRSARSDGFVTLEQLLAVAQVKSPRRKALLLNNGDATVVEVTTLAFKQADEAIRIRLLTSLHGVDIPMASAALAWTFPERWGVLDRRAWAELLRSRLVAGYESGGGFGAKQWREYNSIVQKLANLLGWLPQEVDTWLYRRGGSDEANA